MPVVIVEWAQGQGARGADLSAAIRSLRVQSMTEANLAPLATHVVDVIAALRRHVADEQLVGEAVWFLANLAFHQGNKLQLLAAVDAVADAMLVHAASTDTTVVENCLGYLENVSCVLDAVEGEERHRVGALLAPRVAAVVAAVKVHGSSAAVVRKGVGFLGASPACCACCTAVHIGRWVVAGCDTPWCCWWCCAVCSESACVCVLLCLTVRSANLSSVPSLVHHGVACGVLWCVVSPRAFVLLCLTVRSANLSLAPSLVHHGVAGGVLWCVVSPRASVCLCLTVRSAYLSLVPSLAIALVPYTASVCAIAQQHRSDAQVVAAAIGLIGNLVGTVGSRMVSNSPAFAPCAAEAVCGQCRVAGTAHVCSCTKLPFVCRPLAQL